MGLREDFFSKSGRKIVPVELDEMTVYVRSLSGKERATLMQSIHKDDVVTMSMSPIHLVVMSACDEHGNRLFNDDDFDAVGEHDASVLDKLAVEAGKLNALSADAIDDAKKNS